LPIIVLSSFPQFIDAKEIYRDKERIEKRIYRDKERIEKRIYRDKERIEKEIYRYKERIEKRERKNGQKNF
jgi:hypothetical protein